VTAALIAVALLFCTVGVLLPGSGARAILSCYGFIRLRDDPVSRLLVNFSFGVHLNALIFLICWTFVPAKHALFAALVMLGAASSVAVYVISFGVERPSKQKIQTSLVFMLVLGCAVGLFAAFNFPSSLDSLQVLQVQQFILGSGGGQSFDGGWAARLLALLLGGIPIPAQSGFAGLLFIPSLLQLSLPVATVGAANKIILLALAAVVSLYAARQIKSPISTLAAVFLFFTLIVSQFGLYGLFLTGKDSIFSVLMSIATISALASNEEEASDEPGIFMSAGILLGAVSVPYLLVFWFLFFVCAPRKNLEKCLRQAWWCLIPLTIAVVSVREAFAQPGALKVALGPALALGIVALAALSFFLKMGVHRASKLFASTKLVALLPVACVVAVAFILPVTGGDLHGHGAAAPLDGKTSASDYIFVLYGNNNAGLALLCVLLMCAGPILSNKLRTPWAIALLGFLPATSLFAFAHVKYHWHLLPMFNLWDISRDTIQWYAGAAGGLISLAATLALFSATGKRWAGLLVVAAVFFLTLPSSFAYFVGPWTTKPTLTSTGGFYEPVSAKAFDLIWRDARGVPVYVAADSPLNVNFYSYQMFGPLSVNRFSIDVVGTSDRQILLVAAKSIPPVLAAAASQGLSGWVRKLGDDAYAVALIKDGRSHMDLVHLQRFSVEYSGAYAPEQSGGVDFRWMGQKSSMRVYRLLGSGLDCVVLKFVPAWPEPEQEVTITTTGETRLLKVPKESTFGMPHVEKVCLQFDKDGKGELDLNAKEPGRSFPGDSRSIAFGLLLSLE
jgi:hypothetical protein